MLGFNKLLKGILLCFFSITFVFAGSRSVPGEMIVKLKKGVSKEKFLNTVRGVEIEREINLSYGILYVVKSKLLVEKALINLNRSVVVEYAEPNFIYSIVKPIKEYSLHEILNFDNKEFSYTPNDPKFSSLWGLNNTGSNDPGRFSGGIVGADIKALAAWELHRGSDKIKVAVIDTGIDYDHPDLKENMWVNELELNGEVGIDDDGNGYVDDIYGYDFANNDGDPKDGHNHGSHCAGSIGAVHDNGIGVAGVTSRVSLVAIKFLDDSGSGSSEDAIRSIDYATKLGVDVMSNSWGGGGFSEALKEAIEHAHSKGIIFVAAAGNDSANNDSSPHYPSNYEVDNVIAVAAHNSKDNLASFSCFGKSTVHIAAPGKNILSTTKNNTYSSYSGTSMATPHVSGAVALLLSYEGKMAPAEVRERVMWTSDPVRAYRRKLISGGRLNAYNLLTNFRPERIEPDPSAWISMPIDIFESSHPYLINELMEREVNIAGAKYIRVVVKKFDVEKKFDPINIIDKDGNTVESISGSGEDYKSEYVEGDSLKINFKSDFSLVKWGFVIDSVEYILK